MIFMTDTKINEYGICPVCKLNWDDGDILDFYLDQKKKGHWHHYTESQIEMYVNAMFAPPRKFSKLIPLENSSGFITKLMCPECECEFDKL